MSELVEIGSDGQVVASSTAETPRFETLANRLEQALLAQQARLALAQKRQEAAGTEVARLDGERDGMANEGRNRENMIQMLDEKIWGMQGQRDVLVSKNSAMAEYEKDLVSTNEGVQGSFVNRLEHDTKAVHTEHADLFKEADSLPAHDPRVTLDVLERIQETEKALAATQGGFDPERNERFFIAYERLAELLGYTSRPAS
jgi:chromosome segregation ATPase